MDLSEQLTQLKQETEAAKAQLLTTFQFVPDDKLQWSPSSTARTPLQIVTHCGAANHAFAAILRGQPLPMPSDPIEASNLIRNAGREITTREGAIRSLEESTAEIIQALEAVTPDKIDTAPSSPFGPIPYPVWMSLSSVHMKGHVSQIDYIQTIWGDHDDHNT